MKDSNSVINEINSIRSLYTDKINKSISDKDLEDIRIQILGKKSKFVAILKHIKDFDEENKKKVGQLANKTKEELITSIQNKATKLKEEHIKKIIQTESIDVTLPGKTQDIGSINPIITTMEKCEDILISMGFEVFYPYAVDDEFNNFEALNIKKNHPARDVWDTFWTEDNQLLITHTSSMQHRILKSKNPPIRATVLGRCFRNESTDARHEHTFNQIEGLYVDKNITMTDMLGVFKEFLSKYFEKEIDVKFTPDFFPFVEPGGMMSLNCVLCDGKGCNVCKGTGWLELLGCGMVHPEVLKMADIDPNIYSGFAWGFGVERLCMLKDNINDIRYFNSGNLDFIKQF